MQHVDRTATERNHPWPIARLVACVHVCDHGYEQAYIAADSNFSSVTPSKPRTPVDKNMRSVSTPRQRTARLEGCARDFAAPRPTGSRGDRAPHFCASHKNFRPTTVFLIQYEYFIFCACWTRIWPHVRARRRGSRPNSYFGGCIETHIATIILPEIKRRSLGHGK